MTKMRFLGLVAIMVAAGCGSKSSEPAAGSADATACGGAIETAMTSMMDARKKMIEDRAGSAVDPAKEAKMLERSQHVIDGLRSALTTRCTEDKWPADVLACFGTVKKRDDIKGCIDKLPKDQSERTTSDIMKTMTNGLNMRVRSGGSMPMGNAHNLPLVGGQPMPAEPAGGAVAPAPVAPTPAPAPAPAPAK